MDSNLKQCRHGYMKNLSKNFGLKVAIRSTWYIFNNKYII